MRSVPRPISQTLCRAVVLLGVLAIASTGCVSSRALSNRAVDYNMAAETARNQMILLNIMRSRDRLPMTFTGLSRITGSVRTSAGLGGGATISSSGSEVGVISPNIGMSDSPTFDVAVLDSQEFMRGIMTPIGFDLVEYFWDQGYTREVLLYLTVERVELACPAPDGERRVVQLLNDVDEPSWEAFRQTINRLTDEGEWYFDEARTVIGPPIPETEVTRLPTLIQVAGSGLRLKLREEGDWQLERPGGALRLVVATEGACGPDAPRSPIEVDLYDSKAQFDAAAAREGALVGRMVLRSPQAILFYLGELTRPGKRIYIRERRPGQPLEERVLFGVAEGSACSENHIAIRYDDTRYVIPDGEGACNVGRSMQSLSFAAQLLALQQRAGDLPVTNTVRIIGQ